MFSGQGSQYKGMGKDLFPSFKKEVEEASTILGYDLEELCLKDPRRELGKTQFTQPALYVVNALTFMQKKINLSDHNYFIGHSLGEYNALHAAGAFDFETGLKLVQKRGELMGNAVKGGMAAVLGINVNDLEDKLKAGGYDSIDVANFNTPTQTVISGPHEMVSDLVKNFDNQGIKIVPLFVTSPFHSRYMKKAAEDFSLFLENFKFAVLNSPVISNVTAMPYENEQISQLLSQQINNSVNWTGTIRYLIGEGVNDFEEIGSEILSKMVTEIKKDYSQVVKNKTIKKVNGKASPALKDSFKDNKNVDFREGLSTRLGNKDFREAYGVKYSYITGGMYRGIASKELVVQIGKAKMMGFLGTGGLSLSEIEEDIKFIQEELTEGEAYGMNFLHNLENSDEEMKLIELYLEKGIQNIEAASFMKVTLALVYFRVKGLQVNNDKVLCKNRIIAKVFRPEVAELFMRPAPERLINRLLEEGLITQQQAMLAKKVPMSHDICVEADSGGHTDAGVSMVLLPSIQKLKERIGTEYEYKKPIRIGLAGGIGTPQSIACVFMMGADFVMTGSINQCTVEAGTSDIAKDLLQDIDVQDTDYVPDGSMFEIDSKVQVLKKGVLFSARANKLYDLYKKYDSLDQIPETALLKLEKNYFKKPLPDIWNEIKKLLIAKDDYSLIEKAEQNPKKKMALVFGWYFEYCNTLSLSGESDDKLNFQIHTGPALGAFNQWVKGTKLENWKNRHVDEIAIKMMDEGAKILERNLYELTTKAF